MRNFFILFLTLFSVAFAQTPNTLSITASASLVKASDELQIKIGVLSYHEMANVALSDNSSKMNAIIDALISLGVERGDFETLQFSVNPVYEPYPQTIPNGFKPQVIGYNASNTLLVHTTKLDLIGDIIDAATASGANQISDIRFGIRNPKKYYKEALVMAGKNGLSDAQAISEATGVKLGKIISMNVNQVHTRSPQINGMCFAKVSGGESTPIEMGDLTLEASIYMVFEIL